MKIAVRKFSLEDLSTVEWLIAVGLIVLVTISGWEFYDSYNAEVVVTAAAKDFTNVFAQLKDLAVRRNSPLNVSVRPSTMTRSASYVVRDASTKIIEQRLPYGVDVNGMVTLNAKGEPVRAARFIFRKGRFRTSVWIHPSGQVEIPQDNSG